MNTPSITTRVADLIRNPNSAMPSEWERSVKNKQSQSTDAMHEQAKKSAQTNVAQVKAASAKISPDVKGEQSTTLSSGDTLTLSPLAVKILEESDSRAPNDWERARTDKVQRVQQLIQDGHYTLSPEMVEHVAQKIVAMFQTSS